jgi:hypothetical protein
MREPMKYLTPHSRVHARIDAVYMVEQFASVGAFDANCLHRTGGSRVAVEIESHRDGSAKKRSKGLERGLPRLLAETRHVDFFIKSKDIAFALVHHQLRPVCCDVTLS